MNQKETLFMETIEDHVVIASVDGNIYGLGHTKEEAIDDAIGSGVYEEDLEDINTDDCPWAADEEEAL